jgi:hypothetical protein
MTSNAASTVVRLVLGTLRKLVKVFPHLPFSGGHGVGWLSGEINGKEFQMANKFYCDM